MLHTPVKRAHFIDLQADAGAAFLLTLPTEGVKT
jgi:hypothetical protein